jgi:hypothetical protein
MKFISVRRLAAFFKLELSSIDDELIDKTRSSVNQYFSSNDLLNAFGQDFKLQELLFILDQLKEEKVRVFHGWIEQDSVLSAYLFSNGEKLLLQEEVILPKDHQLFSAYQVFVSSYLAPVLLQKTTTSINSADLEGLGNHLKLSPLLPKEKCIEIQQPVSSYLRQLLAQLKVSQDVDLQNQFQLIFSFEFVQVLNELDENFYSDAIAFIDTAKLVVQRNELSPLVLDKIKSAISSVKLNNKHHEQVLAFCNSAAFIVQRNKPKSTLNNFVRSPLFFVALIAIVINFIFFYPLESATKANQHIKETSGIDGLSAEELNEVDTLLGFKQDSTLLESEKLPNAIRPKYILTAQWENIENTLAREIYSSMIADFEIQRDHGTFYNCADTKKERYGKPLYPNVKAFSNFSLKNHKISNKSSQDVYVLLFNPEKNGKVHGELIASGRSTKVYLKKGNQLIFYSGKQMNSFNAMRRENNGYGNVEEAKKIEKVFDYHFCGQDVYNFQQLNRIYEVEEVGDVVFDEVGNGFGVSGVDVK